MQFIGTVRRLLIALALMPGFVAPPAHGKPTNIPGTPVFVEIPAYFQVAGKFSGLENKKDGSRVVVSAIPTGADGPLAETFSSLSTAMVEFEKQGVRVSSVKKVAVNGTTVPLVIGTQNYRGTKYRKYSALFRGPSPALLSFTIADKSSFSRQDVIAMVRSVRMGRTTSKGGERRALPFEFRAIAPFEYRDALGGGAAILTAFSGADVTGMKPYMMIYAKEQNHGPDFLAAVAEASVFSMDGMQGCKVVREKHTEFCGDDGYYVEAVAGDRTAIQYMWIDEDGGSIVLAVRGATSIMKELRDTIRRIAESVHPS